MKLLYSSFWPRWSSRDRIYPSAWNNKSGHNIWNNGSQDIEHQTTNGIVLPERWQTSAVSPMISLAYCLEKVRRPWNREKGYRQSLVVSLSWIDEAGNLRSFQGRVPEKRELHRERILEIGRGSPSGIHLNTDQLIHVKKLSR